MEELCVKAGTPVQTTPRSAKVIEVARSDTLTNKFLASDTPKKPVRTPGVFKRLLQDTEMRIKKAEASRPAAARAPKKTGSGRRIEDDLLRKYQESLQEREQLKAKWDAQVMREVLPAPQISDYSRTLAKQAVTYGTHLRCYMRECLKGPADFASYSAATSALPSALTTEAALKEDSEAIASAGSSSPKRSEEVSPLATEEAAQPSLEVITEEPVEVEERAVQTDRGIKKKQKRWTVRLTPSSSVSAEPVEPGSVPQVSKSSLTLADVHAYQSMVQRHRAMLRTPLASSYQSFKYW